MLQVCVCLCARVCVCVCVLLPGMVCFCDWWAADFQDENETKDSGPWRRPVSFPLWSPLCSHQVDGFWMTSVQIEILWNIPITNLKFVVIAKFCHYNATCHLPFWICSATYTWATFFFVSSTVLHTPWLSPKMNIAVIPHLRHFSFLKLVSTKAW